MKLKNTRNAFYIGDILFEKDQVREFPNADAILAIYPLLEIVQDEPGEQEEAPAPQNEEVAVEQPIEVQEPIQEEKAKIVKKKKTIK